MNPIACPQKSLPDGFFYASSGDLDVNRMDSCPLMSTQQEIGKQQAKSQLARDTICDATIDCLATVGYGETSLNRVASLAGFSKGAVQHHFPSKEDLVAATANRLIERSFQPPSKLREPRSIAQAMISTWKRMINTDGYRALLEVLIAARTDKALRERLSEDLRQWNQAMDRQSLEAYESTSGNEDDVVMLLTMSRSLMRGLVIQDQYGVDSAQNLRMVERWIELIEPHLKLRDHDD